MMEHKNVYIKNIAQVSAQSPLSDDWSTSPVELQGYFVPATDPQFRDYINPMAARRMTPILKRALVTAKVATGGNPLDAIVTGTGLGCATSSERIINAMLEEGEALSQPTHFMQSTHNTIGSLVAIDSKCHAYNATYSQDGISAECALLDVFIQMRLGKINNALVGSHDELPKSWLEVMKRGKVIGNSGQVPASEASVSMLLGCDKNGAKCEVAGIELSYGTSFDVMLHSFLSNNAITHIDALMTGVNGWKEHDDVYNELFSVLPYVPQLHYKHIFGESFSASALAIYASALCLENGEAPASLQSNGNTVLPIKNLLIANTSGSNKSLILLKSCD
ncbi:MAG: beta-ketoacyl synthase chain length factor [Muribaculaceae bacterium]|nr:beta-ketoacyl synthase chain length factor [Muribaculaceae bacterium]